MCTLKPPWVYASPHASRSAAWCAFHVFIAATVPASTATAPRPFADLGSPGTLVVAASARGRAYRAGNGDGALRQNPSPRRNPSVSPVSRLTLMAGWPYRASVRCSATLPNNVRSRTPITYGQSRVPYLVGDLRGNLDVVAVRDEQRPQVQLVERAGELAVVAGEQVSPQLRVVAPGRVPAVDDGPLLDGVVIER
jgi:hypothetical protein